MRDARDVTYHERCLVGLVCFDSSVIDRCEIDLQGHRFVDEIAGRLWPVFLELRERGFPFDDEYLMEKEFASRSIAWSVVVAIAKDAGAPGQDAYHLSEILDRDTRIRAQAHVARLAELFASNKPTSEIIEAIESGLPFTPSQVSTRKPKTIGAILQSIAEQSETKPINGGKRQITTGIPSIDSNCGFLDGQLIVLGARPSIGKSALGGQIASHVAHVHGPVLFVSLEMDEEEHGARTIAAEIGTPFIKSATHNLNSEEICQVRELAKRWKNIPLTIERKTTMTVERFATLVRRYTTQKRLSLAVLDYLGLLDDSRGLVGHESISHITKRLKQLAMAERIPILVLAQINREAETSNKTGKVSPPMLSQLRGSGSIEQDADIVMLLHRESRDSELAELNYAKGRNTKTGVIDLCYDGARFTFAEQMEGEIWQA
jgi:replicative DNA helicase